MANQQSIWEQVFRNGYDQNDPTNLLGALNTRIVQVQADMANKAPIASPAFTGTPTGPTPPEGTGDTSIITAGYLRNIMCGGRVLPGGSPQSLAGSAWNILNHTGTADFTRGGVTIGPGSQGLSVPSTGIYLVNWTGYLTMPSTTALTRVLTGLALGGTLGVSPAMVHNDTTTSTTDMHLNYTCMVGTSPAQLRPCVYIDATAGPIMCSYSQLHVVRVL